MVRASLHLKLRKKLKMLMNVLNPIFFLKLHQWFKSHDHVNGAYRKKVGFCLVVDARYVVHMAKGTVWY